MKTNFDYIDFNIDLNKAELIYNEALSILEKKGIGISHEETKKILSSYNDVAIKGDRVFIKDDLLRKMVPSPTKRAEMRRKGEIKEKDTNLFDLENGEFSCVPKEMEKIGQEWEFLSGGFSMFVYDAYLKKNREAKVDDLVRLLKLCDSFNLAGFIPVTPMDLPEIMRNIATHRFALEYSQKQANHVYHNKFQADTIFEMYQVIPEKFSKFQLLLLVH
jgi:trimethylamine:corrinoid methyltransferase-like protein